MNSFSLARIAYFLSIIIFYTACDVELPQIEDCNVIAAFTLPNELFLNEKIMFKNNSSESSERYEWRVNGLYKSDEKDFSYEFESLGNYFVELKAFCGDRKVYSDSVTKEITINCEPLSRENSGDAGIKMVSNKEIPKSSSFLSITCNPCSPTCIFGVKGDSKSVYEVDRNQECQKHISIYIQPLRQNGEVIPDGNYFLHGSVKPSVSGNWEVENVNFASEELPAINDDQFKVIGIISPNKLTNEKHNNISHGSLTQLGKIFKEIDFTVEKKCYDPCLVYNSSFRILRLNSNEVNGDSEVFTSLTSVPVRKTVFGRFGGDIDLESCDVPLFIHTLVMGPDETFWHVQKDPYAISSVPNNTEWEIISQFGTEEGLNVPKVGDVFKLAAVVSPFNNEISLIGTDPEDPKFPQDSLSDFLSGFNAKMTDIVKVTILN